MPDAAARRLAALEGAEAALVMASGPAALAGTLLALLRHGDHLLASQWMRADIHRFFTNALPALGVQITMVNPVETRAWRRAVTPTTRALFVECPAASVVRVADLNPPRVLAQELGLALIVDATAASPINLTPLRWGADVVVHDARAHLTDDLDQQAGAVCGTESVIDEVRTQMHVWGTTPSPAAVTHLHRGLDTLAVRVGRSNDTAQVVAEALQPLAGVRSVLYPDLPTHPDFEVAQAQLMGCGNAMLIECMDADRAQRLAADADTWHTADDWSGSRMVSHCGPGPDECTVWLTVGLESPEVVLGRLLPHLS